MFGREKATAQLDVLLMPRAEASSAPAAAPMESVLAPSLTVKGDVDFEGAMRIEGQVHGRITGQGRLTISRGGKVVGDIVAAEVVIQGTVQGNVTAADRLEITGTAQVIGEVKASRLVVAEGAGILGRLDVSSEAMDLSSSNGNGKRAESTPDALEKVL